MTERLKVIARRFEAVGKRNLAWGKASLKVLEDETEVWSRSGPNSAAFEPRPWRMMKVCLCSSAGAMTRGSR